MGRYEKLSSILLHGGEVFVKGSDLTYTEAACLASQGGSRLVIIDDNTKTYEELSCIARHGARVILSLDRNVGESVCIANQSRDTELMSFVKEKTSNSNQRNLRVIDSNYTSLCEDFRNYKKSKSDYLYEEEVRGDQLIGLSPKMVEKRKAVQNRINELLYEYEQITRNAPKGRTIIPKSPRMIKLVEELNKLYVKFDSTYKPTNPRW